MKILDNGIAVLDNDHWISRWVEESGKLCHDETVPLHILPLLKQGDVVVEGGANIGTHTVAYSGAVGISGKVLAFEPNPIAFECLVENTRRLPNVVCHRIGLSDRMQCLELVLEDLNIGASYLKPLDGKSNEGVQCWNLDTYDLPAVDFIKLDVEGYELFALRGAILTIMRQRPILLLEMNRRVLARNGHTYDRVLTFLRGLNYEYRPLTPDCTLDDEHYDLLATPK